MAVNTRDETSLRRSLKHWQAVESWNRPKWRAARKGTPARARYFARLKQAKVMVDRRTRQLAALKPKTPKVIDPNLPVVNKFGALGPITAVIGHYTAGPRDTSDTHAVSLWTQYHLQHARQGWGGIGYHLGVTRAGSIVLLRPIAWKGAHTAGANSGHPGIVMHGTTGDEPTAEQAATLRWLAERAHLDLPSSHRPSRKLGDVKWTGHNDWNATSCPGGFKRVYTSKGKTR